MNTTKIEVLSGAGGEESIEFSKMLARKYEFFAQRKGAGVTHSITMEDQRTRHTIVMDGDWRDVLLAEAGIHRLVRLSPLDPTHRRHTAFCMVDISGLPQRRDVSVASYVFHPDEYAKNHITGIMTKEVQAVLDGDVELLRCFDD